MTLKYATCMFSIFPGIQHPIVAFGSLLCHPNWNSDPRNWEHLFAACQRPFYHLKQCTSTVQHVSSPASPAQLVMHRWRTAWMTETLTAQVSSRFARRHSPALQLWFSWLCSAVSPHLTGWFCNSFFSFDTDWHFSVILAFLEDSMNAIVKNSKCLGVCIFFLFPPVNQENADFNPFKLQL